MTVLVQPGAICGSFAAAGALQMRIDRVQALAQAAYFEAARAGDVAASAQTSLDRTHALGRAFVDGKDAPTDAAASRRQAPDAVFDRPVLRDRD